MRDRDARRRSSITGRGSLLRILLLGLALVAVCPGSRTALAAVWEDVTVVTLGGWEYRGIGLDTFPGNAYVELIEASGARKRLTVSNIRLILDSRGKDITAAVLSGNQPPGDDVSPPDSAGAPARPLTGPAVSAEAPPTSPWTPSRPSERSAAKVRTQGLRFRAMLTWGFGYGATAGDWFEGVTSGLAVDFTGRLAVSPSVYLGLAYMHQKLGVDPAYEGEIIIYDYYGTPRSVWIDMDVHLREIYGLIGYYSDPVGQDKPFAYFEFGMGSIAHRFDATVTYQGHSNSADTSESKFGFLWAGGGTYPLSPTVGLTLEGNMRLTGSGGTSSYGYESTGSTGFLFGIRFGFTLLLGH